ncbi:high mobility group B protein 9-like [Phoenix dactylifera]|uniref:High mobility group B protein 9-like n=1 Tax=Phoenix dactylifera TaxID=42345 RepID=A0A8B9AL58_PHODC|nr:high mobility group B protein 9-like [Phoenix dactylifera]
MGEENGMGEMEGRRAMAVDQVARENVYPRPLYSHEDVVKDRALFMDSMRRFHDSMGTILSIPVLGGKEIDLHLLYREVTQRGGLEKVILEKRLKEVVTAFSFPSTTTSASFVLRKRYLSLLHHYEQVYFFGAQGPPIPPAASCMTRTPKIKLERPPDASDLTMKKPRRRKREHAETRGKESHHFTVTGSIDRKFKYGYFVTVKFGGETLNGVLFHVEQPGEASSSASVLPPVNVAAANGTPTEVKRRKKRRCRSSDPAHPRPSRSAYNFYFAEQYSKLKALYPEKDKEFSKMIGESWRSLNAEEKKVYQDRGVEDKERYRREMEEYGEKQKLQQSKEVTEEELFNAKNGKPE